MEIGAFREELQARGGESAMWLVYMADRFGDWQDGRPMLVLQQAFFTRGHAYAFAEARRKARMWQHYYVFRLVANLGWVESGSRRAAEYETAFGRDRELPVVGVTPTGLAAAVIE